MLNAIFGMPLGWIMWLCYKIVPVYAVALVLFTVLTKVAMVPLAIKQQKSMVKMQIFKPRMDDIQKKYANNREKMQEEMSKLYQEENYNPMSGCLPMLIQFPVLLGLYDVIQKPLTHIMRMSQEVIGQATAIAQTVLTASGNTVDLAKSYASQINIIDAVAKDPGAFSAISGFAEQVQTLNLNIGPIDLTQQPALNHISILWLIPLFSFITSLLLTFFSMKNTQQNSDNAAAMNGMTKGMMYMMPLMSGYIAFVVPAGLGVYWILSNVLMMLQTHLLNKYMNPVQLASKAKAEYEAKKELERHEKIEAKKLAKANGETDLTKALSQKEVNRIKLAEARKRDAEKYGEVYAEVTDEDLK